MKLLELSTNSDSAASSLNQIGIMVNQGSFSLLSAGTPLIEIVPIEKVVYYELLSSAEMLGQQLLIELFECTGRVLFSKSNSYEKLQNESQETGSTEDVSFRESRYLASKQTIPKDKGAIYFSVKPIEGGKPSEGNFLPSAIDTSEELEESVFILSAKVLPSDSKVPFDKFLAGDNGRLEWSYTKDGDGGVELKFKRVKCTDASRCLKSYHPKFFSYTLFLSSDERDLDSLSRCSIPYYNKYSGQKTSRNWTFFEEQSGKANIL